MRRERRKFPRGERKESWDIQGCHEKKLRRSIISASDVRRKEYSKQARGRAVCSHK